jgi:hypothetical protein
MPKLQPMTPKLQTRFPIHVRLFVVTVRCEAFLFACLFYSFPPYSHRTPYRPSNVPLRTPFFHNSTIEFHFLFVVQEVSSWHVSSVGVLNENEVSIFAIAFVLLCVLRVWGTG